MEIVTYSLISFSLSNGLLGFLEVLESVLQKGKLSVLSSESTTQANNLSGCSLQGIALTVGVFSWHLEGLIFGV